MFVIHFTPMKTGGQAHAHILAHTQQTHTHVNIVVEESVSCCYCYCHFRHSYCYWHPLLLKGFVSFISFYLQIHQIKYLTHARTHTYTFSNTNIHIQMCGHGSQTHSRILLASQTVSPSVEHIDMGILYRVMSYTCVCVFSHTHILVFITCGRIDKSQKQTKNTNNNNQKAVVHQNWFIKIKPGKNLDLQMSKNKEHIHTHTNIHICIYPITKTKFLYYLLLCWW